MRLTQPEVIDSCAHWIGAHALALLLVIFLTTLGVISALWRLFELELWSHRAVWRQRAFGLPFVQSIRQRYPRVWRFFGARLAPDSYLGLHLTLGLLITLAAMVGFGALADAVEDREELTRFDQQLAISLHQNGTIAQVGIFEAITHFGDYRTLVCLGGCPASRAVATDWASSSALPAMSGTLVGALGILLVRSSTMRRFPVAKRS